MNILDLVPAGSLKHAAGTSGGEWQGPCPLCGGKDRFSAWPDHPSGATGGKFHCRVCDKSGDAIQFIRERDGLSYPDACRALAVEPKPLDRTARTASRPQAWEPKTAILPPELWQERAGRFVVECAAQMTPGSAGAEYAASRGLSAETCRRLGIGWNSADAWDSREAWGLPPEENKNTGKPRKVWMPAGLVIPSRRRTGLVAVKVRRSAWKPEDTLPKYVAVSGSVPGLALGGAGKPVVVVESELDAVLIAQEAGDLVGALALGSASRKPDTDTTDYLRAASSLLIALDFDQAGIKAFPWWRQNFPKAQAWPVPEGKDVGDLIHTPGYVRAWVEAALLRPKAEQPAPPAEAPPTPPPVMDIAALVMMRQYAHLAPCPKARGSWVYRGQACATCVQRGFCSSWPAGEQFSIALPAGIRPRADANTSA
jgi:DNA primase